MTVDTQALGTLAARAMELLEERYASEDAHIRELALVLEVDLSGERSQVLVTATDPRLWVQLAFLKEGIFSVERELERQEDENVDGD